MSLLSKQNKLLSLFVATSIALALVACPTAALAEGETEEVVSVASTNEQTVAAVAAEEPTVPAATPDTVAPAEGGSAGEATNSGTDGNTDNSNQGNTDNNADGSNDGDEEDEPKDPEDKDDESDEDSEESDNNQNSEDAKKDAGTNGADGGAGIASDANADAGIGAIDITTDSNKTVADGYYAIGSAKDTTKVLDAADGKTTNGTNVQIYASNMSAAQKWQIKYHEADGGYYTIGLASNPNMVLDVADGKAFNGANVQLYTSNGTKAQRWSIIATNGYWEILSHLGNFCLNIAWGSTDNGTNIWLYTWDATNSSRFSLMQYNPSAPAGNTKPIEDGIYTIAYKSNSNYVVDIDNASYNDRANIQLYKANNTVAQRFYFAYDNAGYYTIVNLGSSRVIDLDNGGITPKTNVQQYSSNGSDAQKWAVRYDSANKCYYFVNKATGLALDLAWGNVSNGSNIWGYTFNKSTGQRWVLTPYTGDFIDTTDGKAIYTIYSAKDTSKVFDISDGSSKNGAALQIYSSNNTLAQKFEVYKVGTNTYRIRTAASGGWLTDSSYKVVQNGNSTTASSKADTWIAKWTGTFFSLFNQLTGRVMDLTSGSTNSSTKVQTYTSNDTAAQHFLFKSARLVADGYYTFSSLVDTSYVLDVRNGTVADKSYLQIYKSNNTNAQKFKVAWDGSYYVITAASSDKAINPEWGNSASKTPLWIYTKDGTSAQQWKLQIADGGGVSFINAKSGLAMDISWGNMANGTSVWQYTANNTAAQAWKVTSAALYQWTLNNGKLYYSDGSLAYTGSLTLDGVTYRFKDGTGELIGLQVSNSKISSYVSWMLDKAADDRYGYDQAYRWGERGDYDCSSLVISACKAAGLNTGGASYTGNMRSNFTAHGFSWITNFSQGDLKVGDILLNEGHHTAVYIGNGYIVHAARAENGGAIAGQAGDQDGYEICVRSYYVYTYGGWNGILRLA